MKKIVYIFLVLCSLNAKSYTLNEALQIALKNNQKQKISNYDKEIAKKRYKEALSINYPSLDLSLIIDRRDEDYINEINGDYEIFGKNYNINLTSVVTGRDTQIARAQLKYIAYSGGKISAIQKEALLGLEYSNEKAKSTSNEIILNVKKYFASYVLSTKLKELAQESVDRLKVLVDLTRRFYEGESLKVKKTDYLRVKMSLQNMKSYLEEFKTSQQLSKSALIFEMGLKKDDDIKIDINSIKLPKLEEDLEKYYEKMYVNNHLLKQVDIGLKVSKEKIKEAQSGYLPNIALYAKAQSMHNSYNGGIMNSQNNDSWNFGVALTYNLFNGGLTYFKTQEEKVKKLQLEAKKSYLKSGLEIKLKKEFLNLKKNIKKIEVAKKGVEISKENRDLNYKAYEVESVEAKDVIEAEFLYSLNKANLYKYQYDLYISKVNLDYIIGNLIR
jgi:outer membrane protein TolC